MRYRGSIFYGLNFLKTFSMAESSPLKVILLQVVKFKMQMDNCIKCSLAYTELLSFRQKVNFFRKVNMLVFLILLYIAMLLLENE